MRYVVHDLAFHVMNELNPNNLCVDIKRKHNKNILSVTLIIGY